jgi:hypothetical protein
MPLSDQLPSGVRIAEKRARPGNRNLAELLELLLTNRDNMAGGTRVDACQWTRGHGVEL